MRLEPWLDDLRAEYASRLPSKVAAILDLAAALAAQPGDRRALPELAHAVHRLVGSAGSYGFAEISTELSPWAGLLTATAATEGTVSTQDLAGLRRSLGLVALRVRGLGQRPAPADPGHLAR